MPRVARKGDAISHGGMITSGSDDVMVNGIPAARKGDSVHCQIHGQRVIADGSSSVSVNDRRLARIGDPISCGAVIVAGSDDVEAGG